jgi:hypothetical protein
VKLSLLDFLLLLPLQFLLFILLFLVGLRVRETVFKKRPRLLDWPLTIRAVRPAPLEAMASLMTCKCDDSA